jgi:hypothetical protein
MALKPASMIQVSKNQPYRTFCTINQSIRPNKTEILKHPEMRTSLFSKKHLKRSWFSVFTIGTFIFLFFLNSCTGQKTVKTDSVAQLKTNFLTPPESSRPWVYWFWLNSNVTREGITADLEAMKKVGIGGVLIMDVDQGAPAGKIKFMDVQWQEMFRFAVQEASRLGMEINMNNDAGWNGSGGPWITPEFAMQTLVFSETRFAGGKKIDMMLPQPPTKGDFYRDVAVIAVQDPGPQALHMIDVDPSFSIVTEVGPKTSFLPTDQKLLTIPVTDRRKLPTLDFRFKSAYTAHTLEVTTSGLDDDVQGDLQISNDGQVFKSVKTFSFGNGKRIIDFDSQKAKCFRIKLMPMSVDQKDFTLSSLELHSRFQVKNLIQKALYKSSWTAEGISAPLDAAAPEGSVLLPEKVIDISQYMTADGRLQWDAPAGNWSVLRYGHTYTGAMNGPASSGGQGPDCDKLSKIGIRKHFDGILKRLIELGGPDIGKSLVTLHIDSWEVGAQNWTANIREEFKNRRGYEMTPYLPVFSSRVIGSQQQTERFLWDVRKTVSELIVENYVAEMQKICHENGLKFSFESYTTPANDLDAANFVDEPIAEFWTQSGFFYFTMKSEASAAHLNNHPIVAAESFTSDDTEKWLLHPAKIKALGDRAFCDGINRFIFHRYAMQPWLNQKPGMAMGPWGLHYERTQTWWDYSLPWHTYLARCQYLLRQGNFIADVLNLQPEEPNYRFKNLPITGYDYNACSPDAFQKVRVENGLLIDGAGNKYQLLVLTHLGTMTEQLLSRVRDLVLQGASVLGEPPVVTPGLTGFPDADARLKMIAEELWGKGGDSQTERKIGKGRVFRGVTPEEALKTIGVAPDFSSDRKLNYIHRNVDGTDLFFVANSGDSAVVSNCEFRVTGKSPQWWNPETGIMTPLTAYAPGSNGTVHVPLLLGPSGSGFVVFTNDDNPAKDRVASITRNGQNLIQGGIASFQIKKENLPENVIDFMNGEISMPGTYIYTLANGTTQNLNIPTEQKEVEVSGSWELKFPEGSGAPASVKLDKLDSWTNLPDKEINHFSGTASYFNTFSVPKGFIGKSDKLYLELGKVKVMAKIFVNGKEGGISWKPPYRMDITSLVKNGENKLRIDVVNLWINRQIGDEFLPEDSDRNPDGTLKSWPEWVMKDQKSPTGRHSFSTWRLWKKDDPLQESGLLGPVKFYLVKSTR